jgi:NADPH-dependent 2,4-dienoyl-CoA reductase/sulfur reductase-like enzyme
MHDLLDIAVLGGGPAGQAAAAQAAACGARVMLLDDRTGEGCVVWGLGGGTRVAAGMAAQHFRLDAIRGGSSLSVTARALLLCPGAHERVIPFPGWTLPGVIGLVEAARRLRAGELPGRRVVVAGFGPLLAEVAGLADAAGGEVVAIADIAAGGTTVVSAHGGTTIEAVTLGPQGGGGATETIACDALCVLHGLTPATEAARVLGATMVYAPARGGWVPVLDTGQRTSVPLLYVAGAAAGIMGPEPAAFTGRIAALTALRDLGLTEAPLPQTPPQPPPKAGDPEAMRAAISALVRAIPGDCVVCRCEGVTRGQIDAAIAAGARGLNQIKQFTRCGMGSCQGRLCGVTVAELAGGGEQAGLFTARVPLRPVPMAMLLGAFDYADIPVPAPAPI